MNEGRDRQLAALREHRKDPRMAALQHGVWPFVRARVLRCDQCMLPKIFGRDCPEFQEGGECRFMEERGAALRDQLLGLPWVRPEHAELVADYVYHCQLLELVQAAMAGLGPFRVTKAEVRLQPLLGESYLAWSRHRRQLAQELGLSPASQVRPGETSPLTAAILQIDEEDRDHDK